MPKVNGFRVTEHTTADGVSTVGANSQKLEKVMVEIKLIINPLTPNDL
jgi:hypothetical protein